MSLMSRAMLLCTLALFQTILTGTLSLGNIDDKTRTTTSKWIDAWKLEKCTEWPAIFFKKISAQYYKKAKALKGSL